MTYAKMLGMTTISALDELDADAVDDALAAVDRIGLWRAFILLPPETVITLLPPAMPNADALVESLPWVENGVPRPGTVARLCKSREWIALVTGGELMEDEGALLFKINDQLKSIAWCVFIVPPGYASEKMIARMHKAGVAPPTPIPEELLLKRKRWGWGTTLAVVLCFLSGMLLAVTLIADKYISERRIVFPALLFLAFGFLAYVLTRRHNQQALEEIRNNPRHNAQQRWAEILADRGWEKSGTR
jgi:hypothetical protein